MSARILIVEDEPALRLALRGLFSRAGYTVEQAATGKDAISALSNDRYDLVLTDLALGRGPGGLDVLRESKVRQPETPVVLVTAVGDERIAVEAMKAGATDYLPKSFDNDEIRLVAERALAHSRLAREHRMLLDRLEREYGFGALIGAGPSMQRVFETIRRAAETDLTVLVRGESGTGKELVAQALHQRSARAMRPFVAVNCAAISRELVESELFGHERGAFTGATQRRVGRFETADGGTLFLDEVGDMPAETQAKVLRVLQERCFERVGGAQSVEVDVRIVAATHRDLEAEVDAGTFREDLYYRLRVVELTLPPLRERPEDIPALTGRFLAQLAERLSREPARISDAALVALARHAWPGNVRELRNVVEQGAVMAPAGEIGPDDLNLRDRHARSRAAPTPGETFIETRDRATEAWERAYLREALRQHDGNISRTAEAVGMVRQSLQQKLKKLGLRE